MKDSLWVRWVHEVYTKGGRWSLYNAPITASWSMWKLCKIKGTWKQWVFNDSYSIQEVYMATFQLQPKVNWRVLVWNRVAIPRARFCCWLVALEKLKTKDRLHSLGVTLDNLCPLCAEAKESTQHIYFECPFSQRCLDEIEKWTGIRLKPIARIDFRKYKLKKVQQQIMSVVYTSIVYAIWKSMNIAIWEDLVQTPHSVVLRLKEEVELRLKTLHIPLLLH